MSGKSFAELWLWFLTWPNWQRPPGHSFRVIRGRAGLQHREPPGGGAPPLRRLGAGFTPRTARLSCRLPRGAHLPWPRPRGPGPVRPAANEQARREGSGGRRREIRPGVAVTAARRLGARHPIAPPREEPGFRARLPRECFREAQTWLRPCELRAPCSATGVSEAVAAAAAAARVPETAGAAGAGDPGPGGFRERRRKLRATGRGALWRWDRKGVALWEGRAGTWVVSGARPGGVREPRGSAGWP